MEVMQVLHMNRGNGETSYAKNSTVQSNIISIAKSITEEALIKLMNNTVMESMGIADLGCSSGPNCLLSAWNIIDAIHATCRDANRPIPELSVALNDLPTNDFNYIFASLSEFHDKLEREKGSGFRQCFVSAVAGSFYGRLFPRRSLHFVHSSSSLHWLSQVPIDLENENGIATVTNKGKIYISKTSPQSVLKAYAFQFHKDFSEFLRSRSEELVPGGRMVLSFIGRNSSDPTTEESGYQWELLAQALMDMAKEGIIEEEKIDTFNAPYYAPCSGEVTVAIEAEGSFGVDRLETVEIDWEGCLGEKSYDVKSKSEAISRGLRVANTIRAVVESMLESHFGENVMDELFRRYGEIVGDYFYERRPRYGNIIVSLVRKG
ncbi:PREDICTED: jasmonate O-methyltransferase-like [Tarenaya hassleriana]|uniref:jasmonate O-methyltransferase-like n=1 Tax=Tarenaya hassleriana TaxID=28532 RepID=UPI00053C4D14|nr:PREDICTED: jasmonate O-methyltransferase-like [Tarenaya hassleriana]